VHGLINLDFADVRTIMSEMGMAMMGAALAEGENRAIEAAQKAISSPLLEDVHIEGARGVLINITGGPSLTLHEVNEAATLIQEEADDDANIIFGAVIDDTMGEQVRITVIATGFGESATMVHPLSRQAAAAPTPPAGRRGDVTADGRRIVHRGTLVDPDAELETPTWMRRPQQEPIAAERTPARAQAGNRDEPDYDVPAFLRRGAD
jgi:cell division protein FtsZ